MTRIAPLQGQRSRSAANTFAMSLTNYRRRPRWVGARVYGSLRGETGFWPATAVRRHGLPWCDPSQSCQMHPRRRKVLAQLRVARIPSYCGHTEAIDAWIG